MKYTGITIRGNILSFEKLEKIQQAETAFQSVTDFGFDKNDNLRDEIGSTWSESKLLWSIFQKKIESLPEKETGTSETRKLWMIPFLMQLGYDPESIKAQEIAGQSFAISHQDSKLKEFPILIMGYKDKLDRKPESFRLRMSPHALMQEYLNRTENVYGLVSNGKQLRLLRDSYRLAKLSFIEFNLEKIFEEELYFEFALLFRLLHSSRMPRSVHQAEKSPIETYHQDSLDSGARIRDQLRHKVKEAMEILANGLIWEHSNEKFTLAIQEKKIDPLQFYKFLLRIIYRIIFLGTIEERDLIFPGKDPKEKAYSDFLRKKSIYFKFYSIERLRKLASSKVYINPAKHDLWKGLITTFKLFEPIGEGKKLGILPLGGDLFSTDGLRIDGFNLEALTCKNKTVLAIIENLTTFQDTTGSKVRVNYRDLDVEELGSIYEALLELRPYFNTEAGRPIFGFSEGSQRKLTGSYYTRHDLVAQLIKTALYPVLDDRLGKANTKEEKEEAILKIKVCDPAAGSGHFLIAAAKALGFELAKIRSDEENPGEKWVLDATRDIISQCIHGVDKNPDAVELCRISLWLTGHSNGKPLTFIDHKIKCGDSLVGVDKLVRLQAGIPDYAFKPVTGDDKTTANTLKKRNNEFLKKKQYSIFFTSDVKAHQHRFAKKYRELNQLKIESAQDYSKAKSVYQKTHIDPLWQKDHTASNLFTWAFFQPYQENARESDLVHSEFLFQYLMSGGSINAKLEALANVRALEYRFFHWFLEFPDVFEKEGFDVILGNPPWERVNLSDKEFFSTRKPEISDIPKSSDRNKVIRSLEQSDPILFKEYNDAVIIAEKEIKYYKTKELFQYGNSGLLNTYPLFTERVINTLNHDGHIGFVIPSGFFTDDTLSRLFGYCIKKKYVYSIYDFENSKKIFPDIHRQTRFSLITLSKLKKPEYFFAQFYCQDPVEITVEANKIRIGAEDINRFNPNNKVCPSFRTQFEYDLNKKLYQFGVLKNSKDHKNSSHIHRMINMSTDSHLLKDYHQNHLLPVYESKLIHHYDHRFASFEGLSVEDKSKGNTAKPTTDQKKLYDFRITPRYFAGNSTYHEKNKSWDWSHSWYLAYRDIAASTNERTSISAIIPPSVNSNSIYLIFDPNVIDLVLFHGLMNSIIFDFVVRSKVNLHLPPVTLQQTPCIRFSQLELDQKLFLIPRILELDYTAWDVRGYANSVWGDCCDDVKQAILNQWEESKKVVGYHDWELPSWASEISQIDYSMETGIPITPFMWNETRRENIKAELDAYFALLFGLSQDEVRYILEPKELFGNDFHGDTFPVLKSKELKKYGEYRTRRLVLEAYDRLRPTWDMEVHLAKLKEVWEKYQEDLSEKKRPAPSPKKPKPKPTKVKEPKSQYGIFGNEEVQIAEKVTLGSKVKARNLTQGKDLAFIIVKSPKNAQAEPEYQPISITSHLALPMINAKVGYRFKVGDQEYEILSVK
ncbi:N-6 DNA methylase [Fulvivirgaceae bacterium BMA12]|uniref:site-specific DNA-methyltransferase (adenine-specific) n=1 Tax=Agaribacillus aureus TaxID=3051825 RepID=A0ABT8LB84_9BACT|nr:N-6 DNA methylase [Fulvivirgaceae bacterium BMA12]